MVTKIEIKQGDIIQHKYNWTEMYNKINIEKKDKLGLDCCRWRCSPQNIWQLSWI